MNDTYQRAQEVADQLLQQGIRPTQQLVRNELGRGSVSTIHKALSDWWSGLGIRLNKAAQLPDMPDDVSGMMQALWVHAVAAAERSAQERRLEVEQQVRLSREAVKQAQQQHGTERSELLARLDRAADAIAQLQQKNEALYEERAALERRTMGAEKRCGDLEREKQALDAVVRRLEQELFQMKQSAQGASSAALVEENANLRKVIERQDARLWELQAEK